MPEPKHHTAVIDTERDLRQQNEALRKALRDSLNYMSSHDLLCSGWSDYGPDGRCDCRLGKLRAHAESLLAEKI